MTGRLDPEQPFRDLKVTSIPAGRQHHGYVCVHHIYRLPEQIKNLVVKVDDEELDNEFPFLLGDIISAKSRVKVLNISNARA